MSADIIPFVPRCDRQRRATAFSITATAPDDLVMDHADTAPCEILCHCEERSDEAIHLSAYDALWIASLRSQ